MTLVNMRITEGIYSALRKGLYALRPAVLGNGHLYLGFDSWSALREMFYPVIGLENHVAENDRSRLITVTGGETWETGHDNWEASGAYGPGMSFNWELKCRRYPISLYVTDVVDPYRPIWMRHVRRPSGGDTSAGVYLRLALSLKENTIGEAGFWDPSQRRLYHYKGQVWVAGAVLGGEGLGRVAKVKDGGASVFGQEGGLSGMTGSEVDHGLIESVIGCRLGDGSADGAVTFAFALGGTRAEADRRLDDAFRDGFLGTLERSKAYWAMSDDLSTKVLWTHCDAGGGILASCDTGIMGSFRDHYRYVWHRDAAMCASTMMRQGYPIVGRRFLDYCVRTITEDGFFWQRYRADGERGSGWHQVSPPDGGLPIQEDETALTLVTAGEYLDYTRDLEFLDSIFDPFVSKAARFIQEYVQDDGLLVKPSYDLWEERRGVFSYTQAACVAGLSCASRIARVLGHPIWRSFLDSSRTLMRGLAERLGSLESGFSRGLRSEPNGEAVHDWTPDASLYIIPLLLTETERFEDDLSVRGDLDRQLVDDIRAMSVETWKRLNNELSVNAGDGCQGVARYAGDWYARPEDAGSLPGNIWPVCSAWRLLSGKRLGLLTQEEYFRESALFERARLPSGVMSEQVDCVRLRPVSVAPLVWSHAMYLEVRSAGLGKMALGTISHK